MTISDAEFSRWCRQDSRAQRVVTIELDRIEEVSGEPATQTLYVSNRPYRQSANRYHAIIEAVPEFNRELGGATRNIYSSSYGSIVLTSRGGAFDWLLDAALDGSEARVRLGDIDWPIEDHRLMFIARQIMAQRADPEQIEIQIQDTLIALNKSISGQILIGGTGAKADKPRRFNFGYVRQVECDVIDASALLYSHSDTGTNTVAIAVYDRLTPVSFTDNGDGTLTLDASPDGIITADVVATAPDADPSDTTRHLVSDLVDVVVGLRSGFTADGKYLGAHATFTIGDDEDYPVGTSVDDTRNTFDFLADATESGQFSYAATRLGQFTYGRVRPNDVDSLPIVAFDIGKDDIFFADGIEVAHDLPGYYRIQAIADKNWTQTSDIATGLDADDRAARTRRGLYLKQDDAVGNTYADKPELYDLTLVESPIIETWVSGDGDDAADAILLAAWMEVKRYNGLPWIERIQRVNVGLEFYDRELMDVARLTFDRFGYDAGVLAQIIGIRTRLTDAKIEFTLLRRRLSEPYPEGWERVTTEEDATEPTSFILDSTDPHSVIPPPGPIIDPGGGEWSGGHGLHRWWGWDGLGSAATGHWYDVTSYFRDMSDELIGNNYGAKAYTYSGGWWTRADEEGFSQLNAIRFWNSGIRPSKVRFTVDGRWPGAQTYHEIALNAAQPGVGDFGSANVQDHFSTDGAEDVDNLVIEELIDWTGIAADRDPFVVYADGIVTIKKIEVFMENGTLHALMPVIANVFLHDTFNDTDATALEDHTPDVGGTWSQDSFYNGGIEIRTDTPHEGVYGYRGAFPSDPSKTTAGAYVTDDVAGDADVEIEVEYTLNTFNNGNVAIGLIARWQDWSTYYGCQISLNSQTSNNQVQIWFKKNAFGGGTLNGVYWDGGTDSAYGSHIVRFRVVGTTLSVYYDGDLVLSTTDGDISAAGGVGLYMAPENSISDSSLVVHELTAGLL